MRRLAIIAALAVLGGAALLALRSPNAGAPENAVGETENAPDSRREFRQHESSPERSANPIPQSEDRLAALAVVETVDDSEDRAAAREEWVNAIPVSEIRAVLDAMSPVELTTDAAQLLVRRWAAVEPHVAATWAEAIAVTETRPVLQIALALSWSETDLESALVWANGLTDTRGEVLTQLGYELARDNPLRALDVGAALPPTTGSDELILHALRQWGAANPAAAHAWLQEWPASELRVRAFTDLAAATAERDPMLAAQIAATQTVAGPQQDRAVIGVVQRWAQTDLSATVAWVEAFPAIPLRDQAIEILAGIVPR